MKIHPAAIISKKAKLAKGVSVGPGTIIGEGTLVGEATSIGAYCVLEGNTTIGKNCQIFTGAVIGSAPQDSKYKGEKTFLDIGDNNIIREYSTFNPGAGEDGRTVIGNNNLFMAYCHVAHDCRVGNDCIIANNGTLAGHVTVEDLVVIGGLAGLHQFVRVGKLSIIGGCSKAVQDIPPYSTCDGHPALIYGLNRVGLKRKGISKEAVASLDNAFKILFNSGHTLKHALKEIEALSSCGEVAYLINFLKNSKRGISHALRRKTSAEIDIAELTK